MARNHARQTEVRYSACTFVQVKSPRAYFQGSPDVEQTYAPRPCDLTVILDRLRSAIPHIPPAIWQEIAEHWTTEP
jgi:hypothetical protein